MNATSAFRRFTILARLLAAFAAGSILSTSCHASVASGGKITAYFVDESGLVLFDTDGARSAKPGCAHPTKNNFSFKADTMPKQAMSPRS
ncbi:MULTISPECIES: hypothetical protein [unclassified Sphingobium]|uniref:hypothetical protein n=1 Tax=unclassified Sphingobium TaxID=2611147 RepID=UPI0012903D2F|nr:MULTISPECIES: hypothetical protein [unclassified Sphingobium]